MFNLNHIPFNTSGIAVILLKKVDNDIKFLLLKRNTNPLKGLWCYIGGGIEQGEKAWEAALREVREETGITNVSLYATNQFDQFYDPHKDYIYFVPVFVGFVDNQDVQLNDEHSEYKWLSYEEALNLLSLPGNENVLASIEKHFVRKQPLAELRII